MDREQVEAINTGEVLLMRARAVARQIEERVRKVMDRHGPHSPHGPGGAAGSDAPRPGRGRAGDVPGPER